MRVRRWEQWTLAAKWGAGKRAESEWELNERPLARDGDRGRGRCLTLTLSHCQSTDWRQSLVTGSGSCVSDSHSFLPSLVTFADLLRRLAPWQLPPTRYAPPSLSLSGLRASFLRLCLSLRRLIQFPPPRTRVLPFLRSLPSLPLYARQDRHACETPCTDPIQAGCSRRLEFG